MVVDEAAIGERFRALAGELDRAPGSRHVTFLARWPSRRAMQHARERVRELTARERLRLPVEQVVRELNRFLRGWAGYFRYGNSTRSFDKVRGCPVARRT